MPENTQTEAMQMLDMASRLTIQYLQNCAVNNSGYVMPEGFLESQVDLTVKSVIKNHGIVTQYLESCSEPVSALPSGDLGHG
jgi:Mg/Co/Ni transporter MgtE